MGNKMGKGQEQGWKRIIFSIYILSGALFIPVLFCVIFIGNDMDYYEMRKQEVIISNFVLFLMALVGEGILLGISWLCRKQKPKKWINYAFVIVLVILFFVLYFINIRIAREIIFFHGWDIQEVRWRAETMAAGRPIGYDVYLSMNPNNIPISYILGWLLRRVQEKTDYPYFYEFIHIQVNCVLISLGGLFCCLTVKKLTKRLIPTAAAFLVYLALPGISPWKTAPYTDTYGMLFPIMCIYLYLCYRDAGKVILKYLFIVLSLLSGMCGGLIKPSAYVVVVAVIGVEFVRLLMEKGKSWRYFAAEVLLTLCLVFAVKACMNFMIEELGLDYEPGLSKDWQTYFLVGLNEETTGSYSEDGYLLVVEFQTDRKARNQAALSRAAERIKEKGILGMPYFWLRKMVLVFNEASFEWQTQVADWGERRYAVEMAGNTEITQKLRDLFWPDALYTGAYHTFCQQVWIFCMIGFPGLLLVPEEKRERYLIFIVSFLGIFLYQMLFEARSRYLFIFLPLLIPMSAAGMQQYIEWGMKKLQSQKDRQACKKGEKKHGREQEDTAEEKSPGIY